MASPKISFLGILDVARVLWSGRWAQGPRVEEFERNLRIATGKKQDHSAVAVSSGTQALIIALRALDVGPGDEVLVPALSFAATAHAVSLVGATPVFVDVSKDSFNLDLSDASNAVSSKTRAIIPVHLFGLMCDMVEVKKFADQHELVIIEDAAQAIGASSETALIGELSNAACLSFYVTKNVTSIEGGAIISRNETLLERCRALRNQGMRARYSFVEPGTNARLSDVHATVGLWSLRASARTQKKRSSIAKRYVSAMTSSIAEPQASKLGFTHANHQFSIKFKSPESRSKFIGMLSEAGIEHAVFYPEALNQLHYYKSHSRPCPNAVFLARHLLSLPIGPHLRESQIRRVERVLGLI